MPYKPRAADLGIACGRMPKGPRNKITDVPGVLVGHCTVDAGSARTGVTVVLPTPRNSFAHKPVAACHVLNGYGKTLGLVQVAELGVLETPIALTGTLNVGLVHDALVEATLRRCHREGLAPTSINPVVGECHDGRLSDAAKRPVRRAHVLRAIAAAQADFEEGNAGAGRGMICHGLKGGIGSASRAIEIEGTSYTLGVLALCNHGELPDLTVGGKRVGPAIARALRAADAPDCGSAILVVATDLPTDARQLGRILRRAPIGLVRAGSHLGHGSGDIVIGFTTAGPVPHEDGEAVRACRTLREDLLNAPFRAVAEACEEAVLNALFAAETTTGYRGDVVRALCDVWPPEGFV